MPHAARGQCCNHGDVRFTVARGDPAERHAPKPVSVENLSENHEDTKTRRTENHRTTEPQNRRATDHRVIVSSCYGLVMASQTGSEIGQLEETVSEDLLVAGGQARATRGRELLLRGRRWLAALLVVMLIVA